MNINLSEMSAAILPVARKAAEGAGPVDWDQPFGHCRACGSRLNEHLMSVALFDNPPRDAEILQGLERRLADADAAR